MHPVRLVKVDIVKVGLDMMTNRLATATQVRGAMTAFYACEESTSTFMCHETVSYYISAYYLHLLMPPPLPQNELEDVHQESEHQLALLANADAEIDRVAKLKMDNMRSQMEEEVNAYVAREKVRREVQHITVVPGRVPCSHAVLRWRLYVSNLSILLGPNLSSVDGRLEIYHNASTHRASSAVFVVAILLGV